MSWQTKQLKKLSEISYGYTTKASFDIDGPRFLRITDIQEGKVDWNKVPSCDISEADYIKHKLQVNDIVFARTGATTGKSFLITQCENSVAASYLIRVRINSDELLPEFLSHFFQSKAYWDAISIGTSGSAQGGVNASKLGSLIIPLAPPEEQKHIVAILDQAFADIDKARATAERNLKNARELFDSYLVKILTEQGDDWETKKWGDLCKFVRGPFGGSLKKSIFKESGYVVYEQKHAIHDHFNQLRYFIDEEKFLEMKRFEVMPGEIIMSCSGVTLGRVAVIPANIPRGIINQALLKLTPTENVDVHFLKYWLRSKIFQEIIFKYAGGAAIPNVPSAKIMKEIEITLPNKKEQLKIIEKIELLKANTEKLCCLYSQKIDDLDELKKSILQKAFTGELTKCKGIAA
jgi:type I restriction enzyme S subunit